ncbi:major capsid protein, partial [Candidatus Bacteroides intestinigallinarum]|uniref:major capsid protein n=1 Tax=Candidatus Bacteroides intestinigallinarum TaxID=2838470 RepID=UPI0039B61A36
MADNIFDATLDVDNDVKVNNFDWSHANNLTTQIGRITPIFCDLVPAKTSFRVNPRFGLQFMPMVFPIQTRMKARISFYRYPLRALWKDYKDFIGNFREGLEEPYINFNTNAKLKAMASTGSLGDYLGLPTTLVGKFGGSETEQGSPDPIQFQMQSQYYTKDISDNRGIFAGTRGVYDAVSYEANKTYGLQVDNVIGNELNLSYPASNTVTANTLIPVGTCFKANCEIQGNSTVNDYFEFRFPDCSLPNGWSTYLSQLMQIFVVRGADESKAYNLLTSFEYDSESLVLKVRGQLSQTFLDSAVAIPGKELQVSIEVNEEETELMIK